MAIRKKGKVYDDVAERLRARGIDPTGLRIATFGRSPDHTVAIGEEVIGDYNHISKRLLLYIDFLTNNPEV